MSEDESKKCSTCGENIDESDTVCPHCGAKVEVIEDELIIDLRAIQAIRNQAEIEQIQRVLKKGKDEA